MAKRLLPLGNAFGRRVELDYRYQDPGCEISISRHYQAENSIHDSPTPTIFQLETERAQLEVGASIFPDEIKEKMKNVSKENEEKIYANPPSASFNSKHESNGLTSSADPVSDFIVWWDEPEDQDPDNPMNWSSTRKWVNICVISVISFLV